MTPEEAFVQDIAEHPDDDAPRLIFADWLDDHGEAERAEFVRNRIRHARLAGSNPFETDDEAQELTRRALALLQANWTRWTDPLAEALGGRRDRFNWPLEGFRPEALGRFPRGFVESAEMEAGRFVKVAPQLFRLCPIRHVSLHEAGLTPAFANRPELAHVETLNFSDYYRSPFDAYAMSFLAQSPHLGRLRALGLYRSHSGDEGVVSLAGAAWLDGVRSLELGNVGLSLRGVEALARTTRAFRPERLKLDHNAIGDAGAFVLAASPILERVKVLTLASSSLGSSGVVALARSPYLREAEDVYLAGNTFDGQAAAEVDRSAWGRAARW